MKALKIVPEISYFDTFKEFAENFNLGKGDILVTNKWLFEPIVQPCVPDIQVVYQEKYGVGEPTDEMMDAMKAAMDEYKYDRVIQEKILKNEFGTLILCGRYDELKKEPYAKIYKNLTQKQKIKLILKRYLYILKKKKGE